MASLATDLNPLTSTSTATHEHAWTVESHHRIAAGYLLYVHCDECGTRRVDVQSHIYEPPIALSRDLGRSDVVRG